MAPDRCAELAQDAVILFHWPQVARMGSRVTPGLAILLQMSPQAEEMDRFAAQVIAPIKAAAA